MKVLFKRLRHGALLPRYAHRGDAGMDLCAAEDTTVPPGGRALVPTGLAVELPPGHEAQVRPRSGLALKRGVTVLNTPGTIDEGYRGEIGVILFNTSQEPFEAKKGDRIAQLVVAPVVRAEIAEADGLSDSGRGDGGFGSTGV